MFILKHIKGALPLRGEADEKSKRQPWLIQKPVRKNSHSHLMPFFFFLFFFLQEKRSPHALYSFSAEDNCKCSENMLWRKVDSLLKQTANQAFAFGTWSKFYEPD